MFTDLREQLSPGERSRCVRTCTFSRLCANCREKRKGKKRARYAPLEVVTLSREHHAQPAAGDLTLLDPLLEYSSVVPTAGKEWLDLRYFENGLSVRRQCAPWGQGDVLREGTFAVVRKVFNHYGQVALVMLRRNEQSGEEYVLGAAFFTGWTRV